MGQAGAGTREDRSNFKAHRSGQIRAESFPGTATDSGSNPHPEPATQPSQIRAAKTGSTLLEHPDAGRGQRLHNLCAMFGAPRLQPEGDLDIAERLDAALASGSDLTDAERRARDGILGRQFTLR